MEPILIFDINNSIKWIEKDTYWLSTNPQGTDDWLGDRIGRVTMSKLGASVGHSSFPRDLTSEERIDRTAMIISGQLKEEFSQNSLDIMSHGTVVEPYARDWHANKNGYTIVEHGLAVPKWNKYLGASVDGDIVGTDGIIEIKAPKKMYYPLDNYTESINHGWQPPKYYHKHIWTTHYDQMQGNMAVFGKSWCDYIVYCTPEDRVFTQRVLFNPKYWYKELYPKVCNFIETKLKPLLTKEPNLPSNYVQIEYKSLLSYGV